MRHGQAPDRVHFVGRVSDPGAWYARCHFLLHFSRADGFPGVILEAAAHGKTTLANPFGGIPEQIIPGKTGLLVAIEDEDAVFEAACRLLADPNLAGELGSRAAAHVDESFSAEAVGARFEREMLALRWDSGR